VSAEQYRKYQQMRAQRNLRRVRQRHARALKHEKEALRHAQRRRFYAVLAIVGSLVVLVSPPSFLSWWIPAAWFLFVLGITGSLEIVWLLRRRDRPASLYCRRCRKKPIAHAEALYCGAACSARAEAEQ
jgi:Flp pilus assembly protein TadB